VKRKLAFSLIALALTSGCTKRPPSVDFEKSFLEEKAKYEPNFGKTYWLLGSRFLCPRPTTNVIDCTSIPPTSKLELDGIERGITSDAHYHVKLEDGRTGYIEAFGLIRFATDVDPMQAAAECKRRGDPRVGMSAKQLVATCWGKPDHVDRRETARGISERYVYGKGEYVILRNGIVTAVDTRGRLR
jgi:hypothetical protein